MIAITMPHRAVVIITRVDTVLPTLITVIRTATPPLNQQAPLKSPKLLPPSHLPHLPHLPASVLRLPRGTGSRVEERRLMHMHNTRRNRRSNLHALGKETRNKNKMQS